MDIRQQALEQWLKNKTIAQDFQLTPLKGDASFRRYFRVQKKDISYIAMDAPPPQENCRPFIAIAQALRQEGLHAPEIFAASVDAGFLLLTDFGDRVLLSELNAQNAESLYGNALLALARLQACHNVRDWQLPNFTADFMYQELQIFKEWFLLRHLQLTLTATQEEMLAHFFHFLADTAALQPQVFMHRDFHSANLMVLPDSQIGILDFQDAFKGPVTYDLVSLLRDCYIAWPDEWVQKLVLQYKENIQLNISDDIFLRWFDLMGLQRHLKALLTFSRKLHRDHNAQYLQHIPRTLQYVYAVASRYAECAAFSTFLDDVVKPAMQKDASCAQ